MTLERDEDLLERFFPADTHNCGACGVFIHVDQQAWFATCSVTREYRRSHPFVDFRLLHAQWHADNDEAIYQAGRVAIYG